MTATQIIDWLLYRGSCYSISCFFFTVTFMAEGWISGIIFSAFGFAAFFTGRESVV